MMNKRFVIAKSALILFSLTTVLIFSMLRDPEQTRNMGITNEIAIIIVVGNFALLALSAIAFIYQRARKDVPAHRTLETLESYAIRADAETKQIPEAIVIQHEDLMKLQEELETQIILAQDRLSIKYLHEGQVVKLTSPIKPQQYDVAEVVEIDSKTVSLRPVNH